MNKATRILVVDDEPAVLELFSMILRRAGYEVWEASNGQQCLQVTRERRPDLVLLDVRLPDLNGIDICRQIKADAALLDIFVVLVSGKATNAADKVDAAETGADDYIVKPVDPDEFLARIRTIVRLRDTTAALRASELHYRRLVEILPDAVGMIDLQGRLTTVNRQAVEMLGYAGPGELLGKSAFDLTPPEDHERVKADITTTLETGVMRNAEYRMLRKDGSRFPVELSAAVSTDVDGQSREIVMVVRDITARRQAEARIRELVHILDQAHDAIIIRDLEGHIQYFNKGAERLLGWTAGEVMGRRTTDLFYEDTSTFAEAQKMLLQTGEWNGELPAVTKARKPIILHTRWTLARVPHSQSPHVVSISTDITGHKEAEEALRQSQERYRSLAESSPDAIFILDRESAIQYVNRVAAQWLGKPNSGLLGHPQAEFFPPEIARQHQEGIQRVFEGGEMVRTERSESFRGAEKWVETRLVPLRNQQGKVAYVIGIARDLTEQKRTAEALKEREELSQKIIGTAMEGFWMLDLEGNLVDVNEAYCRMSGYSRQELLSMHTSDVEVNEASPELVVQHIQRIFLSGSDRFETRHRCKDGRIIEVEVIATFLKLRERYVFAFMRDITERKRAEEQIRLLAYAVQSARDLICITDGENRFTFVNQSFVRAYGHSQEEVLGRKPDFLYSPKNPPGLYEHIFRQTLGGSWKGELLNCRKDGTEFPISLSTSEIKNNEGRTIGLIGVASDITERKRAEEELRRLPLRIIEAQEAERLRVARELHDGVNQLIASAKMRLRKVEDGVVSLNPAAREILARCSRLLVQALEENRRIAHNLRPSDLDEFGLAAACRNFCKDLRSRTKLKVKYNIARIDQRLAPALELNLFRIMQEAVNNIEKHARAWEVRLRIAFHGDSIVLKIQDDGRGFDSKRGKAGKGKWRGIGLTNMRERAEFLGGTCTVESAPKQGTTITVRVPCGRAK
jgi:PAS domain S-box-containing protein